MNKYSTLVAFDANDAQRTFDEYYEYPSVVHEPYMCFNTTMRLGADLVASVSLSKHSYHIQYFDLHGYELSNVIFTDNDPDGFVQFFDNTKIASDDCLVMLPSMDDITDEILEKFRLTRENVFVLYNLHNELLKILKKDEMIQKVVL